MTGKMERMKMYRWKGSRMATGNEVTQVSMREELVICCHCHHPIEATSGVSVPQRTSTPTHQRKRPGRRGSTSKQTLSHDKDPSPPTESSIMESTNNTPDTLILDHSLVRPYRLDDLESSEEFEDLSVLTDEDSGDSSLCQDCYLDISVQSGELCTRDLGIHLPTGFSDDSEVRVDYSRDHRNGSECSRDSAIESDGLVSVRDDDSSDEEFVEISHRFERPSCVPWMGTRGDTVPNNVKVLKETCDDTVPKDVKVRKESVDTWENVADSEVGVHQITCMQSELSEYERSISQQKRALENHLRARKRYYDQIVDKWYWKNMTVIETEWQKETAGVDIMKERLKQLKSEVDAKVQGVGKSANKFHENKMYHDKNLSKLRSCVKELENHIGASRKLRFAIGRMPKLNYEYLGPVILQHTRNQNHTGGMHHSGYTGYPKSAPKSPLTSTEVLRYFLPGKCLYEFDSRQNHEDIRSQYMTTGISLTANGELLVTDSGMNTVKLFTASGVLRKQFDISPDEQPTNAIQFRDHLIAVAGLDGVRLYDLHDGSFYGRQLRGFVHRPQGLALTKAGDLLVSGYRANIPVIGVFDRKTYRLKDTIVGDTFCFSAEEDQAGIVVEDSVHQIFSNAWYISTDPSDNVLVSCRDSHSVKTVTRSCDLLDDTGTLGADAGDFFHPAGLCVDGNGRVIVADSQNNRVQVIVPGQQMALVVLNQGHDGIECPMDVALDNGGRLFVLQANGVVKVFQYS